MTAFHAAIHAGDKERALALMSPDIMIYESGYVERSRDEYASHHLARATSSSARRPRARCSSIPSGWTAPPPAC
ncbi:hypothetical protein LP419_23420 [Massilia sp. H-1]|nr:hypothetical protein LP419_23420 [Massilia sp. H-1]